MIGLRIIEIRDVLVVNRLERADIDPPTLLLWGEDFNNVHEAYINDALSPSVLALSDNRLLVQIPDSQVGQLLRSILVTSTRFTRTTKKSEIAFKLVPSNAAVAGIERLAQQFIKVLLQSPSTFSNMGGSLLKALNHTTEPQSLTADFHRGVDTVKRQIITQQAASTAIPLDEQLQDAKLIEARYDKSRLSLVGTLKISNRLGRSSVVGLGL